MPDTFEDVKRTAEVESRPGKTAPTPVPSGLRNEFSDASYKVASTARKATGHAPTEGEMGKSLDWNAQQRKVAEGQ